MSARFACLLLAAALVPAAIAPAVRAAPPQSKELALERSPYLRESAASPVPWRAWRETTLAQARAAGRLVFVSIGYSSCHWCHVMARESFADPAVAGRLAGGFTSLKVDSEERPDLDGRFLARLEALGVSPGWPMNFVLTPEGEVIWGATYVGRDELLAVLAALEARWKSDPGRVRRLASARERQARDLRRPATASASVAQGHERLLAGIVASADPVHGGFGTGAKFPAAAELGLLHEALLRGAGQDVAGAFFGTLAALGAGGLHDAIDGGLFRYSTGRDWLSPHFEKMLPDQAHVARLACRGYALSAEPALARLATGLAGFMDEAFAMPEGLFASAFDAESGGREGGYHLWTPSELEGLSPAARRDLDARWRPVPRDGRILLVPSSVPAAVPSPVPSAANSSVPYAAPRASSEGAALAELRALRRAKAPPRRDDKAITAWNAAAIAALAECGPALGQPRLAGRAARAMARLLAVNVPAGRVHRYSLAGEPVGEGTLEDTAWLVEALAALHDADGDEAWVSHAARLAGAVASLDEGLFAQAVEDFSRDRGAPAAAAVMLRALSRFAGRSEDARFRIAGERLATRLSGLAGVDGFASVTAALHGRASPAPAPVVHAAGGVARVSLQRAGAPEEPQRAGAKDEGPRYAVAVVLKPGWHINVHEPAQDYLKPTTVTWAGAVGAKVLYPAGTPLRYGPTGDVLSVLAGTACIGVRPGIGDTAPARGTARATATIQACDATRCLRPETVDLASALGAGPPCGADR